MFEQTIYSVLYAKYTEDGKAIEWTEKPVKAVFLKGGKIEKVLTEEDHEIVIDDVTTFARRATGMFDKSGAMLFSGDIVKFQHQHAKEDPKEVLAPILWINGAYTVVIAGIKELIYLTQTNVLEMEKIGTVYQHGKILETPIDEAIFAANEEQGE